MSAGRFVRLRLFLLSHGMLPGGLTGELVDAGYARLNRSARPRKVNTL